MRAKGDVARGFALGHADLRFKPLAILINQTDHRNRGAADARSQQSNVIELFLGLSVENLVTPQRFQALCFIRWQWSLHSGFLSPPRGQAWFCCPATRALCGQEPPAYKVWAGT